MYGALYMYTCTCTYCTYVCVLYMYMYLCDFVCDELQEMPAGDEQLTPASRARMRWKWAIEQQLLLLKIEKQNQSVIGKFTAIQQSITMFLWS